MKKLLFKNLVAFGIVMFLMAPVFLFAATAFAQPDLGIEYANNLNLTGANNADPRDMAVTIVRYLMTFLGIIAVVVILLGGFQWMTAGGNEDKIASAKRLIISGIIGLIIILAAFAIVQFVIGLTGNALQS